MSTIKDRERAEVVRMIKNGESHILDLQPSNSKEKVKLRLTHY